MIPAQMEDVERLLEGGMEVEVVEKIQIAILDRNREQGEEVLRTFVW